MKLADWVDEVKATGGVPEGDQDTLAAITSAAALCWAEIDRMGDPRSEIVQLGVKWMAAFMVSCARHGETDFRAILVPTEHQQDVFRREAMRNKGVIAKILTEAALASPRLFNSAVSATGVHRPDASSGRGKNRGG